MTYREQCDRFASIVGGSVMPIGHGGFLVSWTRPDGRLVVDGADVLAVYRRGVTVADVAHGAEPTEHTDSILTDPDAVPSDHCDNVASIVGGRVVRQRESGDLVIWTRGDGACVVLGPDRLEVYPTEDALTDGSVPVASLDRVDDGSDDDLGHFADCPECRCEPGQGVTPGCATCARYVADYGPAV